MIMAKRTTRVGRYRVEDDSVPGYNGEELTLGQLAGFERRAARTVLCDVQDVEPEVLKFARQALGLKQTELAAHLGVTAETISRWEQGSEPFKRSIQLALAELLDEAERSGGELSEPKPRKQHIGKTVTLQATVTLKAAVG
jgi:DNA-binding transcriptional regulator YiaG